MPSPRQLTAVLSFLDSIPDATSPALAKADSRDSMVKTAFRTADAQSRWLGGTLESASARACGRPTAAGRCHPCAWRTRPPGACRSGTPRRSARAAGIVRSPPTRRPRPSVSEPSDPVRRPWRSGCVRSGRHGTPSSRRFVRISRRWQSRRPEASGIAFTVCSALSRAMASSFVSNMASSNCMISLDMASASFRSRFSSVSD